MQEDVKKTTPPKLYSQTEDAALKTAAVYFGETLFPYLGIEEKPLGIAPTEMIRLEIKKMYEDFNYQMTGNRWFHFEFESTSITLDDLKRFREYEAVTSRTYGVAVTTFVICSSKVKKPLSQFTEGLNTYRVKLIRLKSRKADQVFRNLSAKNKENIQKADLVPILLTPLMDGQMPQKERIRQGFAWLNQPYNSICPNDTQKMQAVLYALASKMLKKEEMEEIKEEIAMTLLGQMLMEDGMKKGIQKGIELTKIVIKLSAQGESPENIAHKLQISLDEVNKILED
ncbi:MAG: hypothetical protein Q4D16_24555 [Eubacteriales bacterium]|nr:hypothetical protein [Eubacteriales bacterium]